MKKIIITTGILISCLCHAQAQTPKQKLDQILTWSDHIEKNKNIEKSCMRNNDTLVECHIRFKKDRRYQFHTTRTQAAHIDTVFEENVFDTDAFHFYLYHDYENDGIIDVVEIYSDKKEGILFERTKMKEDEEKFQKKYDHIINHIFKKLKNHTKKKS